MGTYTRVRLLDVSDAELANMFCSSLGHTREIHNEVLYGLFYSTDMLDEDVRFVNNDPDGLKQMPDIPRPMSKETFLLQKFGNGCFGGLGQWCVKISNPTDTEKKEIEIIKRFIKDYTQYVAFDNSENLDRL